MGREERESQRVIGNINCLHKMGRTGLIGDHHKIEKWGRTRIEKGRRKQTYNNVSMPGREMDEDI